MALAASLNTSSPLMRALLNDTGRVFAGGTGSGGGGKLSGSGSGMQPSHNFGSMYGGGSGQFGYSYPSNTAYPGDENWNSWNRVFKLLLLTFVSTIGTMGSIFIISAITVIDTLQVRSNCFLACLASGNLLVTLLVLPTSAIAIMANVTDDQGLCHFQWVLTLACLIISVLSFFFMALDNYFGMNTLVPYRVCCTRFRVFFFMLVIWTAGFVIPFVQESQDFGPNFCKDRRHLKVSIDYHPYVLAGLGICSLFTIISFGRSLWIHKRYQIQIENASAAEAAAVASLVTTDGNLLSSNAWVYLFSLAMWLPMIATMVVDSFNPVPQEYLDTIWYIALANSVGYSYMYACTNRDLLDAFNKLFYYCCCKSHVTFTRKGAVMRRTMANESMGLRVHIIPGLNIYNQRRENCADGCGSGQSGGYRGGAGFGPSGLGGGLYRGIGIYRNQVRTSEL